MLCIDIRINMQNKNTQEVQLQCHEDSQKLEWSTEDGKVAKHEKT